MHARNWLRITKYHSDGQVKQESRKTREGDTVTESDDTSVTVGDTCVNVFEDIDD